MPFEDRADAGRELARHLSEYAKRGDVVVLALPRGGVPVALEVAEALDAPLDVLVVRKLGVPGHEELAMGAIAGGVRVLNQGVVRHLRLDENDIVPVAEREEAELRRRERMYRSGRPALDVSEKVVLLIDDGLATGATMRAAVAALRQFGPSEIVVAVPVATAETCSEFDGYADRTVCAQTPEPFMAVGQWYRDFTPVTDDDVRELLARSPRLAR